MAGRLLLLALCAGGVGCGGKVTGAVEHWGDAGAAGANVTPPANGGSAGGTGGIGPSGGSGGDVPAGGSAGSGASGGTAGTGASLGTGGLMPWVCEGEPEQGGYGGVSAACEGAQPSAMVTMPGGYAIDITEVSRCQYELWLATDPDPIDQIPACSWNCGFTPQCGWPPQEWGNRPVSCVDWCDAYAYCAAMGKRLCGRIGGGSNAFEAYQDPSASEWYNACSSGGTYVFSPGDTYAEASDCALYDAYHDVGSHPGCVSPDAAYTGVYDLTGSAWEWVDACDQDLGQDDACRVRGGNALVKGTNGIIGARCDFDLALPRNDHFGPNAYDTEGPGIRCCADP